MSTVLREYDSRSTKPPRLACKGGGCRQQGLFSNSNVVDRAGNLCFLSFCFLTFQFHVFFQKKKNVFSILYGIFSLSFLTVFSVVHFFSIDEII